MKPVHVAALALTLLVARVPLTAAPPSTRHRWDLSLFSYVQRSPAEKGATANSHPLRVSAATLEHVLAEVRFVTAKAEEPLFGRNEVADLARILSEAIYLAGPGEDIELVSTAKREGGFLDSSLTVTARIFLLNGKLNLLVHDARLDFAFTYNIDFRMPKFEFGSRTKPSSVVLKSLEGEVRRSDWLVLPLAATAPVPVAATPAPQKIAPAAAPPPAPALAPALAPAPAPGLEERLLKLKRLRDQNLITEEDYAKRKQELLKEI